MSNGNSTQNNSGNSRRTNLQILDDRREELKKSLVTYKQFLDTIPATKQESFKNNFLELATQDYLLSIVDTKELIRFATKVTKIGLDISPSAGECYIIPFETKINNQKVMMPQAVVPLNGNQQLAFQKDFMLTVENVYIFDDGTEGAESELTRKQQSMLKTADPEWVDSHFIGFDVIFADLTNELPLQRKFVDKNYVEEATKTLKDLRWKIQTWTHKAVRLAYKRFAIPRDRKIAAFEEIENLNDSLLAKSDKSSGKLLSLENENALNQLGIKLEKSNGIAIATNFNGKEKYLQDFGFTKNGGNWSIEYAEDVEVEDGVKTKANNSKKVSSAKELFSYLTVKKLNKEQIGTFVKDVLGLNKSDEKEISEVLSDLPLLDRMVADFLNPIPNESMF